jgi:alpha-tubulin suppressor-like RCC1 family protein
VVQLSVGKDDACALMNDAGVLCWGDGAEGRTGNGTELNANSPVHVPLPPAAEILVGHWSNCARLISGPVHCWGENAYRQTSDGGLTPPIYVPVETWPTDLRSLALGRRFACAIDPTNAQVMCWGRNDARRLELGVSDGGPTASYSITQAQHPLGTMAIYKVFAGADFACAMTIGRTLLCWGDNSSGQLGTGGALGPSAVSPVSLPGMVVDVSLGENHACAIVGREVFCWGDNTYGQTDYSTDAGYRPTPTLIAP